MSASALTRSPFHVFGRVVATSEFPAIVTKAITDGLTLARKRGFIPIAVQISGGTRKQMDLVAESIRNLTAKHRSVILLPDKAISQFKNHTDILMAGEAIVVMIHGCNMQSVAEVCLENIADGVVPIRMVAWMELRNIRVGAAWEPIIVPVGMRARSER